MAAPMLPLLLGTGFWNQYQEDEARRRQEEAIRGTVSAFGAQDVAPNPADASMGLGQPSHVPGLDARQQEQVSRMLLLGGAPAQQAAALLGGQMGLPEELDKDILEFQQAQRLGLLGEDVGYSDFKKLGGINTNIYNSDFATKPLGLDANKWLMPDGSHPDPNMTAMDASNAGAKPKPSASDVKTGQKFEEKRGALNILRGSMERYAAMINKHGTEMSLFGLNAEDTTELSSAYTNLMIQAKELYNLGVLQGPDMQILEEALPNPTKWHNQGYSRQALMNGLNTLTFLLNDKYRAVGSEFGRDLSGDEIQPYRVVGEAGEQTGDGGVWEEY